MELGNFNLFSCINGRLSYVRGKGDRGRWREWFVRSPMGCGSSRHNFDLSSRVFLDKSIFRPPPNRTSNGSSFSVITATTGDHHVFILFSVFVLSMPHSYE